MYGLKTETLFNSIQIEKMYKFRTTLGSIALFFISFITISCDNDDDVKNKKASISKETQEIITDFYKFWGTGEVAFLEKTTSKELKDHDRNPMFPGTDYEAIAALRQAVNGLTNFKHDLVQINYIGEDLIMIRWEGTATHTGNVLGFPAFNKSVRFDGHDIIQIKNGKIVAYWHIEELLQLTTQLK